MKRARNSVETRRVFVPALAWPLRTAPALALLCAVGLAACQPTVKIEPPEKPIVIDLNVNIKQDVRVKVDRELEDLVKDNPDIF